MTGYDFAQKKPVVAFIEAETTDDLLQVVGCHFVKLYVLPVAAIFDFIIMTIPRREPKVQRC